MDRKFKDLTHLERLSMILRNPDRGDMRLSINELETLQTQYQEVYLLRANSDDHDKMSAIYDMEQAIDELCDKAWHSHIDNTTAIIACTSIIRNYHASYETQIDAFKRRDIKGMYLSEFMRFHEDKGYHFFDEKSMKCFKSRVNDWHYETGYFITSEKRSSMDGRFYTLRKANFQTGRVEGISDFQQYITLKQAQTAWKRAIKEATNES